MGSGCSVPTNAGRRRGRHCFAGALAIGAAIFTGGSNAFMEVCSVDDVSFGSDCVSASPGLGVWAAGLGGLLMLVGGWQIRSSGEAPTKPRRDVFASPDPALTKTCPDCAESVLEAAHVCKHCGYRFDGAKAAE